MLSVALNLPSSRERFAGMTPEEAKADVERRLSEHGWAAQIGRAGYEKISRFVGGDEGDLRQLCSKLIALSALQDRQEITEDIVDMVLLDFDRAAQSATPARTSAAATAEVDLPSIEELAATLDAKAATGELDPEVRLPESRIRVAAKEAPAPRPKLLLVDPVDATRERFGQGLAHDFTVIEASDGEQAWRRLLEQPDIQLIVTELALPGVNGYAFIKQVREARTPSHVADVPIMVLTGPEHGEAKLRTLRSGANDFLTKDLNPLDVRSRAVSRHKANKALAEMTRAPRAAQRARPERNLAPQPARPSASASSRNAEKQRSAKAAPVTTLTAERRYAGDGKAAPRFANTGTDPTVARQPRISPSTTITVTATVLLGLAVVAIYLIGRDGDVLRSEAPVIARVTPSAPAETAEREAANADSAPAPEATSGGMTESDKPPPVEPRASDLSAEATAKRDARAASSGSAVKAPQADTVVPKSADSKPADRTTPDRKVDAPVTTRPGSDESKSVEPAAPTQPSMPPAAPREALETIAEAPRAETPAPTSPPAAVEQSAPARVVEPIAPSAPPNPPPMIESAEPERGDFGREDVALAERAAPAPAPVPEAGPRPPLNRISQAELQSFLTRFASVYEAGDLDQFMGLFADNARTNDRTSRQGIRLDYDSLFRTTDLRQMKLGEINWELNGSEAQGWGEFDVRVRRRGEQEPYRYTGSLTFVLQKADGRLRIARLYHGQRRADSR